MWRVESEERRDRQAGNRAPRQSERDGRCSVGRSVAVGGRVSSCGSNANANADADADAKRQEEKNNNNFNLQRAGKWRKFPIG